MLASVTQNPAQRGEGCVHEFQPLHVQLKKILNEGRSAKLIEGLSSSRRAGDRSILDQLLRHTMPSWSQQIRRYREEAGICESQGVNDGEEWSRRGYCQRRVQILGL